MSIQTRVSRSAFQRRRLPHRTSPSTSTTLWRPRVCLQGTWVRVTLDDRLSFAANIPATARSCRILLYNISRIHPFPSLSRLLRCSVQALVISPLDYSSPAGLRPTQVLPQCTTPPHPALATCGCWSLTEIPIDGSGQQKTFP